MQLVVFDGEGNIPDDVVVKYFVTGFPNRNQEWTSQDGLWIGINIPEGEWFLNAYVSDGAGGRHLVGATKATVHANSLSISDIHVSFGDGIRYPDSCLNRSQKRHS